MASFSFRGVKMNDRLKCHWQGLTWLNGQRAILSRNGEMMGSLVDVREGEYFDAVKIAESHVGGIDADGVLVAPCYGGRDIGTLHFYDTTTRLLKRIDAQYLSYKPYSVGICHWGMGESYLLIVQANARGTEWRFYRWSPESFNELYRTKNLGIEGLSRNNVCLRRVATHRVLCYFQRHTLTTRRSIAWSWTWNISAKKFLACTTGVCIERRDAGFVPAVSRRPCG